MILRWLVILLLGVCFGLWDSTVSIWFPFPLNCFVLSLSALVVVTIFSRREWAILFAVITGFVADAMLPSNAGFVTIRYIVIVFVLSFLSERIFANRSLSGMLALGSIAVLANRGILVIFEWIKFAMSPLRIPEAHPTIIAEIMWMMIVLFVSYLLFLTFTKRFLPLISRSSDRLLTRTHRDVYV